MTSWLLCEPHTASILRLTHHRANDEQRTEGKMWVKMIVILRRNIARYLGQQHEDERDETGKLSFSVNFLLIGGKKKKREKEQHQKHFLIKKYIVNRYLTGRNGDDDDDDDEEAAMKLFGMLMRHGPVMRRRSKEENLFKFFKNFSVCIFLSSRRREPIWTGPEQ